MVLEISSNARKKKQKHEQIKNKALKCNSGNKHYAPDHVFITIDNVQVINSRKLINNAS